MLWRQYYEVAYKAVEEGQFLRASEVLRIAVSEASEFDTDKPTFGDLLSTLKLVHRELDAAWEPDPLIEHFLELPVAPSALDPARRIDALLPLLGHYRGRGRLTRVAFEEVVRLEEELKGPSHPDVAHALKLLADYFITTDYQDCAEPVLRRALQIDEAALGPCHAEVLKDLFALGRVVAPESILEIADRAASIIGTLMKGDTLGTADLLTRSARYLIADGDDAQAEPLLRRASEIQTQHCGPGDARVIDTLDAFGGLRLRQACGGIEDESAEEEGFAALHRVFHLRETNPEATPLDRVFGCLDLAGAYERADRLSEAEILDRRALALAEEHLGDDCSLVIDICGRLARLMEKEDRPGSAEYLYGRAAAILEGFGEPIDIERDGPHKEMLRLLESLNRLQDAEALLRRLLARKGPRIAVEHPRQAKILLALARIYCGSGRFSEAELHCREALEIEERARGPKHPRVASVLLDLAVLSAAQLKLRDAMDLYQRATAATGSTPGRSYIESAVGCTNLGRLLESHHELKEAKFFYEQAYVILSRTAGEQTGPRIRSVLLLLAGVSRKQDRNEEAEAIEAQARSFAELGADEVSSTAGR